MSQMRRKSNFSFCVNHIMKGLSRFDYTMGWPVLPAALNVVHLCLWNGKATMTCVHVCSLPHAHGGTKLLLLLLLLRTSQSWICRPMTTVCLGGWCRGPSEGADVCRHMFVWNIFGMVLPQTHWAVGFSSSQWSACLLEDECVSTQWAQGELHQMWVKLSSVSVMRWLWAADAPLLFSQVVSGYSPAESVASDIFGLN